MNAHKTSFTGLSSNKMAQQSTFTLPVLKFKATFYIWMQNYFNAKVRNQVPYIGIEIILHSNVKSWLKF